MLTWKTKLNISKHLLVLNLNQFNTFHTHIVHVSGELENPIVDYCKNESFICGSYQHG